MSFIYLYNFSKSLQSYSRYKLKRTEEYQQQQQQQQIFI